MQRDGDEASYYFEGGIKSLVAHSNRGKMFFLMLFIFPKIMEILMQEVAIQHTDGFNEKCQRICQRNFYN